MPQFAPILRHGTALAKAANFAGNPTVSGGMSLAQAAIPYLTDSETAKYAVGGLATGQKVYGAFSGGLNQPASIAGQGLGMTGGELSGAIGVGSTFYNMTQGMDDPEAVGLQMVGSVLMMTGNPYLMAAGAVMQFVGPMLQDEEKSKISVNGKGSAKWGESGLSVPEIYHGGSVSDAARKKDGNLGGYLTATENLPGYQVGDSNLAAVPTDPGQPVWKQLGVESRDQLTPEYFETAISNKQTEIDQYLEKAKESTDYTGEYSSFDTPDYYSMAQRAQAQLKDLMAKKEQFMAIAPYGLDTPSGTAYSLSDISESGLPYVAGSHIGGHATTGAVAAGAHDITGLAVNIFNNNIQSLLSLMPAEGKQQVLDKLNSMEFTIDYGGAWDTDANDPQDVVRRLPKQFMDLGASVYDQLWSQVENEFGVKREDLFPLIEVEQPANLAANSVAAPALAGKTFGTIGA